MRIFGSVELQSEHTFLFHYVIVFKIQTFYQSSDVTTKIHVDEQLYTVIPGLDLYCRRSIPSYLFGSDHYFHTVVIDSL